MCTPSMETADRHRKQGGDGDLFRRQPAAEPSRPAVGEQLSLFPDQDFSGPKRRQGVALPRH